MPAILHRLKSFFEEPGKNARAWSVADRAASARIQLDLPLPDEIEARRGPHELTAHKGGNLSSRLYPKRKILSEQDQREIRRLEES